MNMMLGRRGMRTDCAGAAREIPVAAAVRRKCRRCICLSILYDYREESVTVFGFGRFGRDVTGVRSRTSTGLLQKGELRVLRDRSPVITLIWHCHNPRPHSSF